MADPPKSDSEIAKKPDPTGMFLGVILFLGFMAFINWKPTDAEKKEMTNTGNLCHLKAVCSDYPGLRDVCATAGSFEKCMEIKFGSREEYGAAKQFCTNEGNVIMDPAKVPGFFDCWTAKLKGG